MLINAVIHNQQRSFRREHANAQIGIFGNVLPPDPSGINHDRCMKGLSFAGEMVTYTNTAHRRAFTNQPRDFMSGKDNGTVFFGIQHVCCGQTKWINGAIRNFHRANQCRVNGRFDNARLLRVYSFCADPCFFAGANKSGLEGEVIFRQGDKQAVGWFNAVTCNAFQDLVFTNAFAGRFRIGYRIARTAVQQAVVTPGGTGCDVVALNQNHAQPAQGTVAGNPGSRCAAANDNHVT